MNSDISIVRIPTFSAHTQPCFAHAFYSHILWGVLLHSQVFLESCLFLISL